MPFKNKEDRYLSQERHRQANFENLWELLSVSSCVDCGETDPMVLEFDHLPPFTKDFDISRAVAGSTRSWGAILDEIAKCDIVCANDHKRRTAKRGNFKRYQATQASVPD